VKEDNQVVLSPIGIDPKKLVILGSTEFGRLCNELIRQEGHRIGLAQTSIDTTVKQSEPDGGVDAKVDSSGSK